MKLIFSITTLLIAIFINPLWVSSEPTAPWRIGGIVSLTGPAAGWGEMARMGWELGIDEANKSGGLGGRPIELLVEDGATNPSKAVSGFKKLTEIDRVDAVLGDVWDYLTTPLIPLSTTSRKLLVSTIIDRSARGSSPFFFTIGPRTDSLRAA